MSSQRRHLLRHVARCLTVAVCALAYLAAAIGMPIAVGRAKLPSGEAFACQSRLRLRHGRAVPPGVLLLREPH